MNEFLEIQINTAFWEVPRLHLFVLLVRTTCRGWWLWNIGGMILTRENWSTGRKTCHIAICGGGGTNPPPWARASSFTEFLDHIQWRTTVGRTPLDEWSARHRDLYLTTLTTDIHASGGIWIHNLSRRAAADLLPRPHGHWDRHIATLSTRIPLKIT